MFYLGPFSINGVQYIQCDMILNTWTKARTWKSYDCYWARDSAQEDLCCYNGGVCMQWSMSWGNCRTYPLSWILCRPPCYGCALSDRYKLPFKYTNDIFVFWSINVRLPYYDAHWPQRDCTLYGAFHNSCVYPLHSGKGATRYRLGLLAFVMLSRTIRLLALFFFCVT